MANVWPNIQPPSGCGEATEDPAIRSKFENGAVQTRARNTRMRGTWNLNWDYMRGADYRILKAFYKQMRGGALSFAWMHPTDLITYNVRFNGELKADNQSFDFWSASATLEEV